jgi:hypothetical protein
MKRTALALSLILIMLASVVATTRNGKSESAVSSMWVEVAMGSGGIAYDGTPDNGTDLFTISHLEWRVRWSVTPVESGLPVGDGSDFKFVVLPEFAKFGEVGIVSGKVFSETETGILVIQNSYNRTYYIDAIVSGYTSYELIVEENIHSPLLDISPPVISLFSPENKTYGLGNISLTFTIDEPTSAVWYKLDSDGKMGIWPVRNISLSGLDLGTHNLTVTVRDEAGNRASKTVYFSVEETFTITLIAVAAIVLALLDLGLLVYYFKKRKR